MDPLTIGVSIALVIALIGAVVPVIPGVLVAAGAVLLWATEKNNAHAWTLAGVVCAVLALGTAAQWWLTLKRVKKTPAPSWIVVVAALAGVVGFFVIPVVGLPLGFVGTLYGVQRFRLRDHRQAMVATKSALRTFGLQILWDLATILLAAGLWWVAVLGFGVGLT